MKFKDLKVGEEFVFADKGSGISASGSGGKTRRIKYRKILNYTIKQSDGVLTQVNTVSSTKLHHINENTEIEGLT